MGLFDFVENVVRLPFDVAGDVLNPLDGGRRTARRVGKALDEVADTAESVLNLEDPLRNRKRR